MLIEALSYSGIRKYDEGGHQIKTIKLVDVSWSYGAASMGYIPCGAHSS
jgi:hypothetical protein